MTNLLFVVGGAYLVHSEYTLLGYLDIAISLHVFNENLEKKKKRIEKYFLNFWQNVYSILFHFYKRKQASHSVYVVLWEVGLKSLRTDAKGPPPGEGPGACSGLRSGAWPWKRNNGRLGAFN